MENREIDLVELAKIVWRSKRSLLKWGAFGAVVGVIVAFSIPKTYETVVKIAPEGNSNSTMNSSMGGIAAMAGINISDVNKTGGISEKIYPEIISSTPFLLEFTNIEVTYDDRKMPFYDYITKEQKRAWWSHVISSPFMAIGWVSKAISGGADDAKDTISIFKPSVLQHEYTTVFSSSIETTVDKKTSVMIITTTMQDPLIAAIIADSLVVKLQRYMTNYRTSKVRFNLESNIKMMNEAKVNYHYADSLYASALDRNQNLISQSAKVKLERLENEKTLAFTVYQQLAAQVEMSRVKLHEETPIATVIEPASVSMNPISPNRKLIIIALAFLGLFAAAFKVVVKYFLQN